MTRHPIETAAGEAFAPEPEPFEARGTCFRGLAFAFAIGAAVFGGIGFTWWWLA